MITNSVEGTFSKIKGARICLVHEAETETLSLENAFLDKLQDSES